MSATKVLDQAEKQGLLEPKVIADLRKQVAESKFIVTPEAIAKVLVDHEHLTPFQARKLVATALGEPPPEPDPPKRQRSGPALPDELTLADDESGDGQVAGSLPAAAAPEDDLVMLEAVTPAQPAPPASRPPAPFQPPAPKAENPKPASKPAPKPAAPRQEPSRPNPAPQAPAPMAQEEEIVDLEPVRPAAPAAKPKTKWKQDQKGPPAPSAPIAPTASSPTDANRAPLAAASAPAARTAASTQVPPPPALTPLPPASAAAAPPLDDLLLDPLTGQADPLASSALLGAPPPAPRSLRKNVWDSPLLLIGGGLLGVIVVAFFLLWYSLFRGTAAELLTKADEDYKSGSYTSAMAAYELFLKNYANDPNVSYARVKLGMAQLRQVSEEGRNPRQGLSAAKTVLPQIEKEEKFAEARLELSTLLPDIADGFATQATEAKERAQKEELVKLAGEAMELVNTPSYLPASLRKDREGRIAAILDKLKLAERSIQQDRDLTEALAKIAAAEQQGDAAAAYKVRGDLLKLYPILEGNPDLVAAVRKVGDKERELVRVVGDEVPALTDDPESEITRIVLAPREGPAPAESAAAIACLQIESAVYGFDAASGRTLWRRFVGHESRVPPLRLARDEAADVLLVDGRRQELVRVASASGKMAWRQAIGEMILNPVIGGERVFVTTAAGKVMQIDPDSGAVNVTASLPQAASVSAAYDGRQLRLIQPGEHSTLFVLSSQTLECTETYYLGHVRGSLLVPPVAVLDFVLVPESPADDHTLIHVLAPAGESKRLAEIGQPFRLKGRVTTPLAVSGRRLAAVTDLGQIAVYEVDPANRQQAVRLVAGLEATEREPTRYYSAIDGNRLWVASRRCSLYEIQSSVQSLARKWSRHQDDVFTASLQAMGGTLVHARRRPGSPAVIVEGCQAESGQTTWTSHVAAPVAALLPAPGRKTVDALTMQGRILAVGGQQLSGAILDAPAFPMAQDSSGSIDPQLDFSADRNQVIWTESAPGRRVFSYDLATGSAPVVLMSAEIADQSAAPAALWGTSAAAPMTSGRVELLSIASGRPIALPFVPPLSPTESPAWTRPAVLDDGSALVIGDGRQMLYRLALKEQPRANLAAAKEQPFDQPLTGGLVTVGDTVYGIVKGPTADTIVAIDSQTLTQSAKWPLAGRALWGPDVAAGQVFVASEADGLLCLGTGQKLAWQKPLAHGPLAGPPQIGPPGELLLVFQDGTLARVSAASGDELAAKQVGEPLGRAACVVGQQAVVSTSDGALIVTPLP
jgi:TolA-binding protein